jgi:hypothetical protein
MIDQARCDECGCFVDEEDAHHVEAFEETGGILCSECWEGYLDGDDL